MQKQNIKEYEFMREEVSYIKQCITTYNSFLLGGSGAALFAFNIASRSGAIAPLIVSLTAFGMSGLITALFIIVQYKFNSHNRGAGYLKLLSHERHSLLDADTAKKIEDIDFIGWEICIDRLRDSTNARATAGDRLESVELEVPNISGLHKALTQLTVYRSTNSKAIAGFRIWASSFLNKAITKSWGFPIYITLVFSLATLLFLTIGTGFLVEVITDKNITSHHKWLAGIVAGTVVVLQCIAWRYNFATLYKLMQGNNTVDAYCLQLIPMRASFLNSMSVKPSYNLLADSISTAISADPKRPIGKPNKHEGVKGI